MGGRFRLSDGAHEITVTWAQGRMSTRDFPEAGRQAEPHRSAECTCGWSVTLARETTDEIRDMHDEAVGEW